MLNGSLYQLWDRLVVRKRRGGKERERTRVCTGVNFCLMCDGIRFLRSFPPSMYAKVLTGLSS